MSGFSDIHQHCIYGLDDGAKSFEDMTAMLRTAYADGVRNIIATPHAIPGAEPFAYSLLLQRLREAQEYCAQEGLALRLYPGAEIMYTPAAAAMVADGKIPTLANSQNVLVEFMPDATYQTIEKGVHAFVRNGYTPILAHIERYRCLMMKIKKARQLKEAFPVAFQVNCSTIVSSKGFVISRAMDSLLKDQLIDYVATDAHNCTSRPSKMRSAYQMLVEKVGDEYAQELMGMK